MNGLPGARSSVEEIVAVIYAAGWTAGHACTSIRGSSFEGPSRRTLFLRNRDCDESAMTWSSASRLSSGTSAIPHQHPFSVASLHLADRFIVGWRRASDCFANEESSAAPDANERSATAAIACLATTPVATPRSWLGRSPNAQLP